MKSPRSGFTFIELIVAMAIMIMIAATVVPVMVGALDQARAERAVEGLENLAEAIEAFEEDVSEWPGQLTQLSSSITTSQANACAETYNNGDVDDWEGPYVLQNLSGSGVQMFIGVADNQLIRTPTNGNNALLRIRIPSVSIEDIEEVDDQADASDGQTAGSIMWDNPVNGQAYLYYVMSINGC